MIMSVDRSFATAAVTSQVPGVTAAVTLTNSTNDDSAPGKTAVDFLTRVVPWPQAGAPGFINMHWTNPDHPGMGGRPFSKIADFLAMVPWCNSHPEMVKDVYFCLSQQSQTGPIDGGRAKVKRSAANATFLKAIWLDIDVKAPPKGYADLAEAMKDVRAFCAAKGYPFPNALVASGGGLHAYWIADNPMTVFEWLGYATALRTAAEDFGLRCDAGLTTDCARVLRVPSTFNHKTIPAKPVVLLHLTPDYAFKGLLPEVAGPMKNTAKVTSVPMLPGRPAGAFAALTPEGFTGIREFDDTPLDPVPAIQGCPMLLEALRAGGKNQSQGLWNLTVLANTFFKSGHKLAHQMSSGYKTYDPAETEAMWERKKNEGLGWPSCKAISNECGLCKTCPHFGKIKSPLHLSLRPARASPDCIAGHVKEGKLLPVEAILTLRKRDADKETLFAALNETYAVVRYGNEVLIKASPVQTSSLMKAEDFHKMFGNVRISGMEVALSK